MRQLHVEPDGWPCALGDCPPGLFEYNGELGLKSQYHPHGDIEVFAATSGESFWGGADNKLDRLGLVVQPVKYVWKEVEE